MEAVGGDIAGALATGGVRGEAMALARLRQPVDAFFDRVTVNAGMTPSCARTGCACWARSARRCGASPTSHTLIEDTLPTSRATVGWHDDEHVGLQVRRRQGRRHRGDARAARRQGRQPRRDVHARPAGAARASPSRPRSAATTTSTTGSYPEASPPGRRRARQGRETAATFGDPDAAAARLGALGRAGVHAGHDGHGAQPRAQRPHGRGPRPKTPPAIRASPTTATAASSRCTATWCSASTTTCSRTGCREVKRQQRLRPRHRAGARSTCAAWSRAIRRSSRRTGAPFPQDVEEQLWGAIGAVFGSWMTPRAVTYRRLHGIDNAMGTAVNVQAMVFGNRGERAPPAWPSPATRRPARSATTASSWSMPRARTWSPASARHSRYHAMKEATGGSLRRWKR